MSAARLLLVWVCVLSMTVAMAAEPFCTVVRPEASPPLIVQAAAELSCYLERLTDGPVPIATAAEGGPSIILRRSPEDVALGDEGYDIVGQADEDAPRVTITAQTSLGVLHGAYRLLREYGLGFYFDGDSIPTQAPKRFLLLTIRSTPVFAIRGSLPWYNFLNSPTTWDEQDFRFFADQIIRSGQNFVGFHSYDYEPFAAYSYEGQLTGGQPLATTRQSVWGTQPLPVDAFGFGTARFFPGEYWGSDAAQAEGTREELVAAHKALLARGLQYASARGVKTCLGFEVSGDPTNLEETQRFRARLQQLLVDYPMLDYVWLWQPEGQSVRGSGPPPLRSQAGRVYREWEQAFSAIDTPARKWEGMRVAYYARLARQTMDGIAPKVDLVLSGWGGDNWLHVSDYFPCWDKVLDKRIIFAALDNIRVTPTISHGYSLPADRERWAIPWYEYDGDQWFPQANAHVFAQTVRDARQKGCRGLLGIHWRTKEVGESQALAAQYAWSPEQSLEEFYTDYGVRRVGTEYGPRFARLLQDLDALAYRWIGGPGQSECGRFAWCHVTDEPREGRLARLREGLIDLRKGIRASPCPSGALGRVDDIIATLDRGLAFNKIAGYFVAGGPVAKALDMPGDDPAKAQTCGRLLDEINTLEFGNMLDLWARTITSRGELGVLATINGKAFADYRDKVVSLSEACGREAPDLSAPDAGHRGIISDYQLTTAPAGAPLMVRCVAYDGPSPAQAVTMEYTTSSQRKWRSTSMAPLQRSVFEAQIPVDTTQEGWVRYRVKATISGQTVQWPQTRGEPFRQVHIIPAEALMARGNEVLAKPQAPVTAVKLTGEASAHGSVRLSWPALPGPGPTRIQRRPMDAEEWTTIADTLDWVWEDMSAVPGQDYAYRLLDADTQLGACDVRVPEATPPATPAEVVARPYGTSVRLSWAGADLSVAGYTVERAVAQDGPWVAATPDTITPTGFGADSFVDYPATDGTLYYRIAAIGHEPGVSAAAEPIAVEVTAELPPPVLAMEFHSGEVASPTGEAEFTGPHSFETVDGREVLRTQGGFTVPYGEVIAVKDAFTVAVRFRVDKPTPIPVLVCQGAWEGPGYFVQLMSGSLRFYVGGAGFLDQRLSAQPGRWYTAVCVYDGATLAIYVDGVLLGDKRADGPFEPSTTHLAVGRYDQVGPEWTFKGDIDFVYLYNHPLEPAMIQRGEPPAQNAIDLGWSDEPVSINGAPATWHQQPAIVDAPGGKAAELGGGLTLPFADWFGDRFEVSTQFLLKSVEGMPVLVNQGLWPGEGYMLQVLEKRIRWHIGGVGSLDCGPELRPNRWYKVRCTYDAENLTVYLDGKQVGRMQSNRLMAPSPRPVRIGRYEAPGEQYVVNGLMGRTHIGPLPEP